MTPSFNQQFDQHGAWRRSFAKRLKWLSGWLDENELLDQAVAERLKELEAQMRTSKVMVAFVAEFSRGKSELINAIFFAGYGRRIMPASAGRTTMCPTELGYDAEQPPSLRLLPIETRLEPHSLMHWRDEPARWTDVPVDVDNAESLSAAMSKVAEVRWVPLAEARALGFWSDDAPDDNPLPDDQGRVEIPRWRHAVLNMPHPLLEQGLIILDTPGLNAIGAEPELTVSLIPQAHAVVFILGADTGVTRSDLSIWREHLITEGPASETRIVVLNKIDTMWDTLSTPAQIDAQIERQRRGAAELLGVPLPQVLPVSAQKGLQAKIRRDDPLLRASRLPGLEAVLGEGLLGKRETMLRLAVDASIGALRAEASRIINVRQRDLSEQVLELQGLRGKNVSVIRHMRSRIEQEQNEFETSNVRILAVRSVQGKLLREVYAVLGSTALKADMAHLAAALKRPGIKLSVRKVYGETFDALRNNLREVQATTGEIQSMLHATFRQLNAEHGFTLQAPAEPDLSGFEEQLTQIEQSHIHYLGVGNLLKLAQADFCDKLVRALSSRLRVVNEAAMTEVERWSKGAGAQLDAQLKERRRNFGRRLESVERIQGAAGNLDERLAEIAAQDSGLTELQQRLDELTSLLTSNDAPVAATAASAA
ncbi:dynamin family protein [Variovorax arabinosiphilus]|uniref:dynamin family protein n=1 Tax=Variovorax arabinosiphilus TaxID=3053498 RepID=UPI0025789FC6|nr:MULTISPECIES: dynamin family protein [unclassified Variovorax]MDM0120665.1 dynamin family protein [Variovorax sp. J2L1-78]MDM0127423.1 dynamin family protein [Variovorax sp. J2L1-63]MDM0231122.1 dynamin family protein [Variovorax sp. J2R1-6]